MRDKLKPCPFCGEEAVVDMLESLYFLKRVVCSKCGATTLWSTDEVSIQRWNNRKKRKIKNCPLCGGKAFAHEAYDGTWRVQCAKCDLTSPCTPTREAAIAAWNRRPDND